jgi:NAD dependent epimerase/dehydratase family enzyme
VDLVSILLLGLGDPTLRGVVNAVTPNPERNADFIARYAAALHRPAFLPVPRFAIELVFGREQGQEMLLWGQRVRPGVLEARGFEYAWPRLEDALRPIVDDAIALPLANAAALEIVG